MRIACFCWQKTSDIPTVRLPPGIYGETVTLTFTEDIVVDDISITTCLKPGLSRMLCEFMYAVWIFLLLLNFLTYIFLKENSVIYASSVAAAVNTMHEYDSDRMLPNFCEVLKISAEIWTFCSAEIALKHEIIINVHIVRCGSTTGRQRLDDIALTNIASKMSWQLKSSK